VGADGAGGPVRRAGRQSLRPALRHHRHPELVLPRDAGLVPGPAAGLPETGAEGELSARGPIVTRGYFNDPERTAAQPSQAELLSHCRRHLAAFKVPRQVRFLGADDLPKTGTGKVQKYRLVRDHLDR
jgi:acyl-CoA synthetase (AMP-forming)/AMP-acid ligase II